MKTKMREAGEQADFEKFCDRVYIKLCDSGLDPETAGALLDKYGATIVKDSFTNGRNAAETAAAVNSAHSDESKSESKKKEGFRLELVDTITVPMWLYDAYTMGKEYGGNLTFTEQEKLADFREQYGSYHLDNHDEEAQYHGTNEFDGMGGLCYDVDVYKRSSDESKKNESKDEDVANYGTSNPSGFRQIAEALKAMGFDVSFEDEYTDCLLLTYTRDGQSWVLEYNPGTSGKPNKAPWELFDNISGLLEAAFQSSRGVIRYLSSQVGTQIEEHMALPSQEERVAYFDKLASCLSVEIHYRTRHEWLVMAGSAGDTILCVQGGLPVGYDPKAGDAKKFDLALEITWDPHYGEKVAGSYHGEQIKADAYEDGKYYKGTWFYMFEPKVVARKIAEWFF